MLPLNIDNDIKRILCKFLLKEDFYNYYVKCLCKIKNKHSRWFLDNPQDLIMDWLMYLEGHDFNLNPHDYEHYRFEWKQIIYDYLKKKEKVNSDNFKIIKNISLDDGAIKITMIDPNGNEFSYKIPAHNLVNSYF